MIRDIFVAATNFGTRARARLTGCFGRETAVRDDDAARGDSMARDDEDVCWICLGRDDHRASSLQRVCSCPRRAHADCIARWQLQNAGKYEEVRCRFCETKFPDWKPALTPADVENPSEVVVMAVTLNGREERVSVRPGMWGRREFEATVRETFGVAEDDAIEMSFECEDPTAMTRGLRLDGRSAFDGAFHCASITSARRRARIDGDFGSSVPA